MPNKDGTKSGGRQKGTVNRLTDEYKEIIAASNPVEFLIDAFTYGYVENKSLKSKEVKDDDKFVSEYLSAKERCDIAKDLAKKIVPDLNSVDHGDIKGAMTILMHSSIPHAPNEKLTVTNETESVTEGKS
jgi:arginine utilization protein RocB